MLSDFEKKIIVAKELYRRGALDNQFTPPELCQEILDKIDVVDKTILTFNIEFVLTLVYKYNVDRSNITMVSSNTTIRNVCERSGVKCIDTVEPNMKFDVVIGNPPYQRSDSKAKRWTLWEEFVNKSLDNGDNVAMIVPQSLTSPGPTWDRIKKHCEILNIDVKKNFSVGSTFCYFVVDQTQEFETTKIVSSDGEFDVDIRDLPCLPNEVNDHTLKLLNDLVNRPKRTWKRGELHTSNKDKFDTNGKYEVLHTNAQTLRSNVEHSHKEKFRVAVTLSGYPKFKVIHDQYCSQATVWTEFNTMKEAVEFADDCNGSLIQEMVKTFKWSGWNSKEIISLV